MPPPTKSPEKAPVVSKVPPQYRGTKTYRLTAPHYRKGVTYEAGALITVTDEVPGRTWEAVEDGARAVEAAPGVASTRPSDLGL